MTQPFLVRNSRAFTLGSIVACFVVAACGERSSSETPTAPSGLDVASGAQPPAAAIGDRGIRLLKGSELRVEPATSWTFTRNTATLKGQHGFRFEGVGGDGPATYPAAAPCELVGCAPNTPLPLTFFLYDGNIRGVARLQGRTFDVGGAAGGQGDVGALTLTFEGTLSTPPTTAGSTTVSAPFTAEGRLLFPPEPASHPAAVSGSGQAIISFVWEQFPDTGSEGWALTSARYVFD